MDKQYAETLSGMAADRLDIVFPNFAPFMYVLEEADDQERTIEHVQHHKERLIDTEATYTFSLRRLVRNLRVDEYHVSAFREDRDHAAHERGEYSTDRILRMALAHHALRSLMKTADQPFSALGKLVTATTCGENETVHVRSIRPILVIPGADDDVLDAWEESYIIRQKFNGKEWLPLTNREYEKLK